MSDLLQVQLQASLGASYVLERELGGGGMSRVFVARDERLGRQIVVKVLSPELAAGLSADRFAREIRLAAALQEPHIVPVLSDGVTADGLPWYTMPFVNGASLRERLRRDVLPSGEAISILRDIAKALSYAHGRGIVHRDIKPENILLSSGTAVVTDFGIAKALHASRTFAPDGDVFSGLTQTGTSLGTPAYMAPEQASGDDVDARADLYAWGVVAYELLSGVHPFAGRTTVQQLIAAHMTQPAPMLVPTDANVSPSVTAIVMQCLAKDPAQRPSSADELTRALDRVSGPVSKRSSTRRSLAIGAAALFALAAVGVTAWWARSGRGTNLASGGTAPIMLAVLPFEHSGPADQQTLTDALSDALTAQLGAMDALAVIDRHSAGQYRDSRKPSKQIGDELGVQYLVEGVVRWTKDASGVWRARLTPTLVDARKGTTKWTGDPVDISLSNAEASQTVIATDVAKALQVKLSPTDRARFAGDYSRVPEALAAFDQGVAILNEQRRRTGVVDRATIERAIQQFERAVQLDSSFGHAWSQIALKARDVALGAPTDRTAAERSERAMQDALRYAPNNGLVLAELASRRWLLHDTVATDTLTARALRSGPRDAYVLQNVGFVLIDRGLKDSGYALVRTAAVMDPRNMRIVESAGTEAYFQRRWSDASAYAESIIKLDAADERGWWRLLTTARAVGDTLALQRGLARTLAALPKPSVRILGTMEAAGGEYSRRYMGLTAAELNIASAFDSVRFYYNKLNASLRVRDSTRARIYADSARRLAIGIPKSEGSEDAQLSVVAYLHAVLGDIASAKRTLAGALTAMHKYTPEPHPTDRLPAPMMAGLYARLGQPEEAVQWLEADTVTTRRALAIDPKVAVLRGTPPFEAYLRAHPQ